MPDWKQEIRRRLAPLKLEPSRETSIVEELVQHLQEFHAELLSAGSTRAEAERRTLAELSERGLLERELRSVERQTPHEPIVLGTTRRSHMIGDFWQDLRYGLRMLHKESTFTIVAVLTLALGIGANTAIFTLFDKVLVRALPVEQPQQLVNFVRDGSGAPASFSYPMYSELCDSNDVLSGLAAYYQQPFSLSNRSSTERVIGKIVSGNYFAVFNVRPALGRYFLPEEDSTPGTHPVVVISHGLWRRQFAADPAVVGKTVGLNGYSYTVVGVAPPEFTGTIRGTSNDVYVPMKMQVQAQPGRNSKLEDRGSGWLRLTGRLKPNVTRQQAQTALSALTADAKKTFPGSNDPVNILLVDGSRGHADRIRDLTLPLKLLMGVVGLVLLIACANVANLLLARASARRREIAVRLAIGASRWRIARQLLTESMLLATLSGSVGLVVAAWLTSLLLGFQQQTTFVPRTFDGGLDGRVLGFTLALSLLTGILFGLGPALQAVKPDLVSALKDGVSRGSRARRFSLRDLLVVGQVALSIVVLISAGLCVKSLRRLQTIDAGIESAKVLTASFDLALSGYNETRGQQFFSQLSERVAALPGVEAVSFGRIVSFSGGVWIRSASPEGYQPKADERVAFDFNTISPDYFNTLGTPLVRGREFSAQDVAGSPRVVIINEATARRYWPNQEAVGKRLKYGNADAFAEIVGVVRDTKSRSLTEDARPAIYTPLRQQYAPDVTLHVRTTTEDRTLLAALSREVQALDAALPVYNLGTLAEQKNGLLYAERFATSLLTLFGLLALSLAVVGLYGVLSQVLLQRTREFGVRLALGAQPRDLLKLVVGQGMVLTIIGLAIGIVASFYLTRLVGGLLFGVSPTDALTFLVVPLLLVGVALVACWIPARRAAKVDPITALRYE